MTTAKERAAARERQRQRQRRVRALRVGVLFVGVLALLVVVAGIALAVLSTRVSGDSMYPTLHDGDRFLSTPHTSGSARRFDVVVAHEPGVHGRADIVKRVIAVPGDGFAIGSAGDVFVRPDNAGGWYRVVSSTWAEHWAITTPCCTAQGLRTSEATVQVVPQGRYFVIGDNADASTDSRSFGWLSARAIEARVGMLVWPLSALGHTGNQPHLEPAPAP